MPLEPLPKELQAKCIAKALESSAQTSSHVGSRVSARASSSIGSPMISILGYGVTTRPIVAFLNKLGKACAIYDDKLDSSARAQTAGLDSGAESSVRAGSADCGLDSGNIFRPASEFAPESSMLEILSPGIPPHHAHFSRARHAVSEYDFIQYLLDSGELDANLQHEATPQAEGFAMRNRGFQVSSADSSDSKIFDDKAGLRSCERGDKAGSPRTQNVCCSQVNRRQDSLKFKQAESNTPESSEPQAEGFAMRNRGFQARGEGSYLSGSDQAPSAESAIYRAKPTPQAQIWVSGTNGKTTTTQMLQSALSPHGARSGGNIGTPLITLYEQNSPLWVLETSSFALHYTTTATPEIYALLPLSPDHISWHGSFEAYVGDKLSPLARMGEHSVAIVPSELRDHGLCQAFVGEMVFYTDSRDLTGYVERAICGSVAEIDRRESLLARLRGLAFFEPFLLDSLVALAACAAYARLESKAESKLDSSVESALDSGAFWDSVLSQLEGFKIGAHRVEEFYVAAFGQQWLFVDDSKGTNLDATLKAIARYKDRALFLILGGDDKGADCEPIFTLLARLESVEIFTIGTNEPKLLGLAARHGVIAHKCGTLDSAMRAIWERIRLESSATESNVCAFAKCFACLLSPAAASLDQFSSYKERGDRFKALARGFMPCAKNR